MEQESARARLDAERQRLEQTGRAAQDLVSGDEASPEGRPHPENQADQSSETFERERDTSVLQRVQAQLAEIDAALARIESGSYGVCELCGEPIGEARLEAKPAARYCVEDQARAEREGRSGTGLAGVQL